MIDLQTGLLPGNGVVVAVVGLVGGLGVGGLLRAYIQHRTRLQVERERSARTLARARSLYWLAGDRHDDLRIDERDRDGRRVVELRGRRRTGGGEAV
jgi:hypothetical protein